ncbi:gem-associated protein 6-like [Ptychodera flava]|uniref:gem-associated protein 6-like n=1 Tax=Ptychodera flava TaxID=63121 RepID=UPI00396A0690
MSSECNVAVAPTTHGISVSQLENPRALRSLVYKEVKVEDVDGKFHVGWVHTVDPVSNSFVLAQFGEDMAVKIVVVMGHAVRHIEVLNNEINTHQADLDRLFARDKTIIYTQGQLQERKVNLKEWLEKNRIPVTESGDNGNCLSISEALFIEPPYTAENCISTNEIILGRIQSLIRAKPES